MSDKREKRKNVKPVDEAMDNLEKLNDNVFMGYDLSPEPLKENETMDNKKEEIIVNGVVCNCMNLNVRKETSIDSDVLGILPKDSEVIVLDDTINGWYKIKAKGIGIGFCMSKFIKIKP